MTKPTVLVVGNNQSVQRMFHDTGFKVVVDNTLPSDKKTRDDANLVCFTGGEDVDPVYYGEKTLPKTRVNPRRDVREAFLYERYLDTPKVGICRGGQFLNVMSGGALWQHVDNHGSNHAVIDLLFTKKPLMVTSTHHQMMIPGKDGFMLAMTKLATQYISDKTRIEPDYDSEVLWYPKTRSLCFQPHPEYPLRTSSNEHREYFFKLLDWAYSL